MNATNKIGLGIATTRIGIVLGLALTCFSERAAAGIITGNASGPGTYNQSNNTTTSYTPLPVGPGPGGGSTPINPKDYGMCGLLNLSGTFGPSTVARITVIDGYYTVQRVWEGSNPLAGPNVAWTCVHFTDFTGLPPVADGGTFQPAPLTNSGGATTKQDIGGYPDACIWAGLAGSLSSPSDQSSYVSAQYYNPLMGETLNWAQAAQGNMVSTYTFCTAFKGFPSWTYTNTGDTLGNGSTGGAQVPLPFNKTKFWCYMDGTGTATSGSFNSAGLGVLSGPDEIYYQEVGKGSWLWYNCLPLAQ